MELDPIGAGERLRVAYLGDLNSYARSRIRLTALRERGCEVWAIPTQRRGSDALGYAPPRLWERILFKLGFRPDVSRAGEALLKLAGSQSLDVIWVDKGLTIDGRALRRAKAASGAKAVSFSEDDMALPHNRSARWVAALDAYDLVVTTKIANIEGRELEVLGARRVAYVTQTFDPHQHYPASMSQAERAAFGEDLSFVGIFEAERANSILALAQAGLRVRVWGPRWGGKLSHPNLRVEGRPVVNAGHRLDYSKVMTASKIGLGFLRKLNRDQHTSRSLEIPACGAMLLAERTPVHLSLFKEGVEAEFFADDAEMIAKARFYLDNEDSRRRVAQAGHERCVRDYSSAGQMQAILAELDRA